MTANNNEELDNDSDSTEPALIPANAQISFARKNDLQKVLRRADKSLDAAFKLLEDIIKDDKADQKLKIDAAKFLIDRRISVSSEISRDNLSRAIAQSRLLLAERATQQKQIRDVTEEGDDYSQPKYCPEIILDSSSIRSM